MNRPRDLGKRTKEFALRIIRLLEEGRISNSQEVVALRAETGELAAIFVTIIKKTRLGI